MISQCNRVFQFSDHDQLTGEDRPVMRYGSQQSVDSQTGEQEERDEWGGDLNIRRREDFL